MADVVSAQDITVIMLDNDEAEELGALLEAADRSDLERTGLTELADALLTPLPARHPSTKISWTLTNPRFEAVEEGNGIVMHPVCGKCGKFVFAVDGCKGHA